MIRRRAGTPTLVIEPRVSLSPVLHSLGTIPARQAILRRLVKRPIQHFTLKLHLTQPPHPFGPRPAAGPPRRNFWLRDFLIEYLEHIDPDLKLLQQPLRRHCTQLAPGL